MGWLKNIGFPGPARVIQENTMRKSKGIAAVSLEMQLAIMGDSVTKQSEFGGFSLSVLDEKAVLSVQSKLAEEFIKRLIVGDTKTIAQQKIYSANEPVGGGISSGLKLKPNETKEVTFLVTWYFPHLNGNAYDTPGWVGHIYNNWYSNSFDVAQYVGSNFNKLLKKQNFFVKRAMITHYRIGCQIESLCPFQL